MGQNTISSEGMITSKTKFEPGLRSALVHLNVRRNNYIKSSKYRLNIDY